MAEQLAALPEEERQRILAEMSDEEAEALQWDWRFWARPKQLAPDGDWYTWLILAGRGFGKTRSGAEWIRERVNAGSHRIVIVGRTAGAVRDEMIEGESGLLAVFPPDERPRYEPSKQRVTFKTGAVAALRSADEPDTLRGTQFHTAWADELAAWKYSESWDQMKFGGRLGRGMAIPPQVVVTTTPKPTPAIKALVKARRTVVTTGSTFENSANLAQEFLDEMRDKYEGTRLGRQELYAEILSDTPGALWTYTQIEALRARQAPELQRIVVAIDPAVTAGSDSDETGIVVAGISAEGVVYVLDDLSGRHQPHEWASIALAAYRVRMADCVVAEVNNGGDLVERNLRFVAADLPVKQVRASKGKATRAEPVSSLYQQGKVRHVGMLSTLEDQMCSWVPGAKKSPDRMDALVWAVTELKLGDHYTWDWV